MNYSFNPKVSNQNRKKRGANIFIAVCGLIMLVIFACAFFSLLNKYDKEMDYLTKAKSTTATVGKVDSYTTHSGKYNKSHTKYKTFVTYKVNGKIYYEILADIPSSWKKGDKVTVYYNPNHISDCRIPKYTNSSTLKFLMYIGGMIFGLLFIITGIICIIKNKQISNKPNSALYPYSFNNSSLYTFGDLQNLNNQNSSSDNFGASQAYSQTNNPDNSAEQGYTNRQQNNDNSDFSHYN